MRAVGPGAALLAGFLSALIVLRPGGPLAAQAPGARGALSCDLSAYRPLDGLQAESSDGVLSLEWQGAGDERLRLRLTREDGAPVIDELALRDGGGAWTRAASGARVELRVVEGLRRISRARPGCALPPGTPPGTAP